MRPKLVLLTLVVALGLVILAVGLKSMATKSGAAAQAPADSSKPAAAAPEGGTGKSAGSNNTAITEQLRIAEIEKQKDEIRGIIVDGASNPAGTSILVDKVTHNPEPSVRSAALEAIVALSDTNAIPGLQAAQQVLENPREKAAILDAIDYLSLPGTIPSEETTNSVPPSVESGSSNKIPTETRKSVAAKAKAAKRAKRGLPPGPQAPQAAPVQTAPSPTQPQTPAPASDGASPQ